MNFILLAQFSFIKDTYIYWMEITDGFWPDIGQTDRRVGRREDRHADWLTGRLIDRPTDRLLFSDVSGNGIKRIFEFFWSHILHRGSYMSAHVLLNLSNELGKKIRCEALPSILSAFPNEFNKFNNTGARMQDSIYHMTLKSHFISKFCNKTTRFRH